MERFDVVVVGGGPAGALTATAAARRGARVLLLERARRAPARCAGLISPRALALLRVPEDLVLAEISRARVHSPGGRTLEFSASQVKGYVIDRAALDELLLSRAAEAGVVVRRGVAATGYEAGGLFTGEGEAVFSVLVGADGPVSSVARWASLPRPRELLVALQAVVRARVELDTVEVFLGRDVAPGFFAWAVPAGEGMARVGLATASGREAGRLLARLLATRFPQARVVRQVGGLIPIGPPDRTVSGQVLLVGDAAGQVKPTSGGGLYFLALCAGIAGEIAAQGPDALPAYEARWRKAIWEEIAFGLRARRVLAALTDEEIDRAFSLLADEKLLSFLSASADIDRPSELVKAVLGRPALWGKFIPLVEALGGWARVRKLVSGLP